MREVREGERWFFEVSDFIGKFLDIGLVNYCGFERVNFGSYSTLCGVFEIDSSVRFNSNFMEYFKDYSSDRINCILAYERVGVYRHCLIVVLN